MRHDKLNHEASTNLNRGVGMQRSVLVRINQAVPAISDGIKQQILQIIGNPQAHLKVVTYSHQLDLIDAYSRRVDMLGKAFAFAIAAHRYTAPAKFKLHDEALNAHVNGIINAFKIKIKFAASYQDKLELCQAKLESLFQHLVILFGSEFNHTLDVAARILSRSEDYVLMREEKPALVTLVPHNFANDNAYVLMAEVPQCPFSATMIQEFIAAKPKSARLPEWYRAMNHDEQLLFDYFMRDLTQDNFIEQVQSIPSKFRMIPGVPNFAKHILAVIDQNGNVLQKFIPRYRSSMISPRDFIKVDERGHRELRQKMTLANAEHLLRLEIDARLQSKFPQNEACPRASVEEYLQEYAKDRLHLIQTLISPVIGSKLFIPDRHLHQDKVGAIKTINENGIELSFRGETYRVPLHVFDTNHALNMARHIVPTGTLFEVGSTSSAITDLIIAARKIQESLQGGDSPSLILRLKIISEAISELESLVSDFAVGDPFHRELHIAGLEELIVSTLAGYACGSCVSGKDRKGLEALYVDAMLLYVMKYHAVPKYNDTEANRNNFIKIFVDLYLSHHQEEYASLNAPGAVGIKTPDNYLPQDILNLIKQKSDQDSIFAQSDRLASNNELHKLLKTMGESEHMQLKANIVTHFQGYQINYFFDHYNGESVLKEWLKYLRDVIHDQRWESKGFSLFDTATMPKGIAILRSILRKDLRLAECDRSQLKIIFNVITEEAQKRGNLGLGRDAATKELYALIASLSAAVIGDPAEIDIAAQCGHVLQMLSPENGQSSATRYSM